MKGSRSLFDHEADGDVLRLAGIGVHDSVSTARVVRGGLFGGVSPNGSRTDEALDAVRGKFGEGAIVRGTGFDTKLIQQGPSRVDESLGLGGFVGANPPNLFERSRGVRDGVLAMWKVRWWRSYEGTIGGMAVVGPVVSARATVAVGR